MALWSSVQMANRARVPCVLEASGKERSKLPERGGGRRRTYELMKLRLNGIFKAVFFRSQDGETECQKVD